MIKEKVTLSRGIKVLTVGGTFVLYMLLSRYLNLDKLTPRNQEDSLLLTVTETMDSTNDLTGRPVKGAWIKESRVVRTLLLVWTLYGACCVMADGILTPAVSVISAVAGTQLTMSRTTTDIRYRRPGPLSQQFHRPHLNRNHCRACTPPWTSTADVVRHPTIRDKMDLPAFRTRLCLMVRLPLHRRHN